MNYDTDFRKDLISKMKEKGLNDSSIMLYVKNLQRLNNEKPLANFNFLKEPSKILDMLKDYKETTKRAYLISIVSALRSDEKYLKLYKVYRDMMENKNKELREKSATNEMTEQQKQNWISWDEVKTAYNKLKELVDKLTTPLNEREYNILLNYMVLSLYYHISPRRNDYGNMNIVKVLPTDESLNYLVYDNVKNKFVFNNFKTAKKEGQIIVDIPDELNQVLKIYLKHHPLLKEKSKGKVLKATNEPFLVQYNGEPVGKHSNGITRVLNRIFSPKKVSSSMLRHIYLSDKYGDTLNEMKKDSTNMSHSLGMQKEYIKNEDNEIIL